MIDDRRSIRTFHHVGFVVPDIVKGVEQFVRSLAAKWDGRIHEDPHQKVKVTFLTVTTGEPLIELVEPLGEKSPVKHFLTERGGGLHHICYEVGALEDELALMKVRGAVVVRHPKPAVAFGGRRIAWVFTAEKLLVELLERNGKQPT